VSLTGLKGQAQREGWAEWIERAPGAAANERAMLAGCRFDERLGLHVVDFFARYLQHSKGRWAGQAFELLDWQYFDLVMPLFGWVRADGLRRFRRAYIEVPKKQGKSTLAAGVGLYLLCADGEMGAEIYSTAVDTRQASIVHGQAVQMVDSSPHLKAELRLNRSTNNISHPASRSFYRALSSVPGSKEGLNAQGLIIDELHAWRGRKLYDTLRYATRARQQPLTFMITTAGDEWESVCREEHDYSRSVRDGEIEDSSHFGLIYAAEPEDDWTDEETWRKANPSLGETIDMEDFRQDFLRAQRTPSVEASWKRYSLNIWSTGGDRWIQPEQWQACRAEFCEADLFGEECFAGLDLAKTRDSTALVLLFPREDGTFRVLPYFWLPERTAGDYDDRVSWLAWAAAGYVRLTPGEVCDYGFVRAEVRRLAELFEIREMAYDPYNAEQTTQEIEQGVLDNEGNVLEEGTGIERVSFAQTLDNFAPPTMRMERLILSQQIRHNGHPVLAWQMANCHVRPDANENIRPLKPKRGDYRKIDGPVAMIMALGRWMEDAGEERPGIQV